jgi:TPR repeat protein
MTRRHFATLVLVLVLAGCVDRDKDIKPVIPPLPAETMQRAEAGDAAAQFKLAEHYLATEPDDPQRMLRWLRKSAERGYPLAQTSLGVLYLAGDSVPLDRIEAYAWFYLASGQNETSAIELEGMLNIDLSDEEIRQALELARHHTTVSKP